MQKRKMRGKSQCCSSTSHIFTGLGLLPIMGVSILSGTRALEEINGYSRVSETQSGVLGAVQTRWSLNRPRNQNFLLWLALCVCEFKREREVPCPNYFSTPLTIKLVLFQTQGVLLHHYFFSRDFLSFLQWVKKPRYKIQELLLDCKGPNSYVWLWLCWPKGQRKVLEYLRDNYLKFRLFQRNRTRNYTDYYLKFTVSKEKGRRKCLFIITLLLICLAFFFPPVKNLFTTSSVLHSSTNIIIPLSKKF